MKIRAGLGAGALLAVFALLLGTGIQPKHVVNLGEVLVSDQFEVIRSVADKYLSSSSAAAMTPDELYREYVLGQDSEYYLVDIRASEDFISSNIPGSVNIPYAQTASPQKLAALPKDKILVIIDYNGHWAAQTAATWNMLGYQAVPLLYGIQGWTLKEAPTGYDAFPRQAMVNPLVQAVEPLVEYSLPELRYDSGNTDELIALLSRTYLDRNYKGLITAEELLQAELGNSENYLVDVRERQHYRLGHLEDSVNIPLAELADAEMLKHLPWDKRIVLIGYDGLDASQGTRVLVTLGYDAVALKYGMSYWHGDEQLTGVSPISNLAKDYYELAPLNYLAPSTGAAGCS